MGKIRHEFAHVVHFKIRAFIRDFQDFRKSRVFIFLKNIEVTVAVAVRRVVPAEGTCGWADGSANFEIVEIFFFKIHFLNEQIINRTGERPVTQALSTGFEALVGPLPCYY